MQSRPVDSVEAERLVERIALQLSAPGQGAQVREYIMDQYVVLYVTYHDAAQRQTLVQLLAVKHQRQLGFDMFNDL